MVKLFVEGGGSEGTGFRPRFQESFKKLLSKLNVDSRKVIVIPSGGRDEAFENFQISLLLNEEAILLVDSEKLYSANSVWKHLENAPDKWEKPALASEDNCYLMVQVMESWFFTNLGVLKNYYVGFVDTNCPAENFHKISKYNCERFLIKGTKHTGKGRYHKSNHSPDLLGLIDPSLITCPEAQRFFNFMKVNYG